MLFEYCPDIMLHACDPVKFTLDSLEKERVA